MRELETEKLRIWRRGREWEILGRWVVGRVRAKEGGKIVVREREGRHW